MKHTATALAILVLAGCAVGPNFHSPPAPVAKTYIPNQAAVTTGTAAGVTAAQTLQPGAPLPPQWWHAFASRRSTPWLSGPLPGSPDVAQFQARLLEAQASMAAQSGATRFPTLDATVSAARQRYIWPSRLCQCADAGTVQPLQRFRERELCLGSVRTAIVAPSKA